MPDKFKNKYRIESTRLQNWDYGWAAAYFVTICTKNREHFFGEIKNGNMNLSGVGIIADVLWNEIKNHAINIELGEFVVMPNHVHGIIVLNGDDTTNEKTETDESADVDTGQSVVTGVEAGHALPLRTPGQQRFRNPGKNTLSSIVGGYKSAVTKHANRLQLNFAWQTRFHDHIIRDGKSFDNISNYIKNNPLNWTEDQFSR